MKKIFFAVCTAFVYAASISVRSGIGRFGNGSVIEATILENQPSKPKSK